MLVYLRQYEFYILKIDGTKRFFHGVRINCAHLDETANAFCILHFQRLLSICRFYIVLIVFYDKLIMHRMDKYKYLRANIIAFINTRENEKVVREWFETNYLLDRRSFAPMNIIVYNFCA